MSSPFLTDDLFEKAFLQNNVNITTKENNTLTNISSNQGDGVIITKVENVDALLQQAKKERDEFTMSRNTQDHYTKVATIPVILYDKIMDECDRLQITNKRDRQKYLLQQVKEHFAAMLTVPPNYLRG